MTSVFHFAGFALSGLVSLSGFAFGPYYRNLEQKERHIRFIKIYGSIAIACYALGWML